MGFLTPLYMLGLAAVSLPIIFHMIRRVPRDRLPFSAVQFLDPSPPRVSRRRLIENWPLLLLRALALCLLAFAFSRPFLRNTAHTGVSSQGRRIAVLLDTSASMRRADLWDQAVRQTLDLADDLSPADHLGLFAFDRDHRPIVSFREWASLEPAARREILRRRLGKLEPGWAETDLGTALMTAADVLHNTATDENTSRRTTSAGSAGATAPELKQIVLISDLQRGSRLKSLQGAPWPEDVTVAVRRVRPQRRGNAGLHLIEQKRGSVQGAGPVRVRITNAENSTREQFQIRIAGGNPAERIRTTASGDGVARPDQRDGRGPAPHNPRPSQAQGVPPGHALEPVEVYVPPGQSRVVRVPRPESDAQKPFRLILKGDGSPFDNAVTAAPPRQRQLSVVYFGSDSPTDPDGLRYYLERAFPATPGRQVSILAQEPDAPLLLPENRDARLAVVTGAVSEDHLNGLRSFTRNGGTLLFVMTDPSQAAMLNALLETDGVRADEAEIRDYAMFSEIDFSHPLFAPFAEPEFADFTKIHVWRHRSLTLDGRDGVRIPARFDDGDPAVVEFAEGDGRVVILTTGWHPPDSQLALSSKFVPLMNGLLDLNGDGVERRARYIVGDPVPVPRPKSAEFPPRVRLPDDREIELASGQSRFEETVVPGLYTVTAPEDDGPSQFTVHLAADESRTAPLPVETLERHGVRLNRVDDGDGQSVSEESSRQLQARELEDRQQFWRWLIGTAVVVLLAETWLAGRLTHRPSSRTP